MRYAVLTIAALFASPAFAQAYKCPSGGGTVYQDKPCAGGVQVLAAPQVSAADDLLNEKARPAEPTEPGVAACRAGAAGYFKDPDSVKVGAAVIALEPKGKRVPTAKRWLLQINAKNGYGGYAGNKTYLCVTTTDGSTVTSVVPWG